jgi:hypothetical protein
MSSIPMAFVALSMRSGRSSKFVMDSLNFASSSFSFAGRALSGMIFVAIDDFGAAGERDLRYGFQH